MAKRPQGLLNAGALSRGLLAVSGVTAGVARGGGRYFLLMPPGGRFGRPRACLGATRAAPPAPRGRCSAVPGSPVQNKMTRIASYRGTKTKLLNCSYGGAEKGA
jgi:hypothetical protein